MKTYAIHKIKTALNTEGLKITPNDSALPLCGVKQTKKKHIQR